MAVIISRLSSYCPNFATAPSLVSLGYRAYDFFICSVRAEGSLTVVFCQARIRLARTPNSFIIDPTVPVETLTPRWLSNVVS